MKRTFGEWSLSIDSEFHTTNRHLELWMNVNSWANKGNALVRTENGYQESSFRPSPEQIETLWRLTAACGVMKRTLDVQPIIDDSDYQHHVVLVCRYHERTVAWTGDYQLFGFEGPDADALEALLSALKAFASPKAA